MNEFNSLLKFFCVAFTMDAKNVIQKKLEMHGCMAEGMNVFYFFILHNSHLFLLLNNRSSIPYFALHS